MNSGTDEVPRGEPRFVPRIAVALALALATLDVAIGVANSGTSVPLIEFAFPWFATMGLVLAAFALVFALVQAVSKPFGGDARMSAIAAAAGAAIFTGCVLAAGFDYISPRRFVLDGVAAALGGAVAMAAARALFRWSESQRMARTIGTTLAVGALAIALQSALSKRVPLIADFPDSSHGVLLIAIAAAFFGARAWSENHGAVVRPLALFYGAALVALFAFGRGSRDEANVDHLLRNDQPVKHVFLVTVDTLRADVLSCYSKDGPPTPRLDAFAANAVLFESARSSAPWTMPSMASVLTGASPQVHLVAHPTSRLPPNLPTLAERFEREGYRTASIGNNVVLLEPSGMQRGFDESIFFPRDEPRTPIGTRLVHALGRSSALDGDARDLVDLSRDWIERHKRESFFLWLHILDPHLAYEPPHEFAPKGEPPPGMSTRFARGEDIRTGRYAPTMEERAWIRQLYDGEVRSIDANLGRFFEYLKSSELFDESVIVFSSDHGEEFWEHGRFEHGQAFYDELLHVPLIVKPSNWNKGLRIADEVSNASIAPTILTLSKLPCDPDQFSRAPLLVADKNSWKFSGGQLAIATDPLFFGPRTAIVEGGFKYVRDQITGEEELYDLALDPQELHSIAATKPERVAAMRAALDEETKRSEALREHWKIREGSTVELDAATNDRLRQLGYLK